HGATHFHTQCRQSVECFTEFCRIVLQATDHLAKGEQEFFPATFSGSSSLKLPEQLHDDFREPQAERMLTVACGGHRYFFLLLGFFFFNFSVSSLWIASNSASTCSADTIGSSTVYFCRSAAVKFFLTVAHI